MELAEEKKIPWMIIVEISALICLKLHLKYYLLYQNFLIIPINQKSFLLLYL